MTANTFGGTLSRFAASRSALLILLALCTGLAVALCAAAVVGASLALPSDGALRVGKQLVTVEEMDARGATLQALYGVQPPQVGVELEDYRRALAKSVAIGIVIEQVAAERGIVIPDAEGRSLLAQYVRDNFAGDRDAFIRALSRAGTAEPVLLREVKLQAAAGRLLRQVSDTVPPVTDSELRQAFEQRRAQLMAPEQRHIRNIVVSTRSSADQILAAARTGGDFGTLARNTSLDASTRDGGGDLGVVPAATLEKSYADSAFQAASGAFFGPVRTTNGWNIGQVTGVTPARPLTFDEVGPQLRQELTAERALDRWRAFIEDRLAHTDITYAPDYRPETVTEPTADGSTQLLAAASRLTPPAAVPAPTEIKRDQGSRPIPESGQAEAVLLAVGQIVAAALLVLIGRWGRRQAPQLVSGALPEAARARKIRVYQRGAVACQVAGAILALTVVASILVRLAA